MKTFTKTITVWMAMLLGSLAPAPAQDQGYNQIAPKTVPLAGPAGEVTPPPAPPVDVSDSRVVLKRLNALVFVPTPEAVDHGGTEAREPVVINKVDVPDEAGFRELTTPYVGQRLTHGQLNALITGIIVYYRQHDRPIIDVIVPVQKITNGVVQIVILEGKVGDVSVTGTKWFPPAEIRNNLSVQPGDEIRASKIQSDLDWVNQNPFHTSDLVYEPGSKLGQTNLVLQTKDRFPARVYAGYEDSGNAETGFDRYEAGLNWGDAFDLGLGQELNYQYTTSGDGQSLQAHSGSYIMPLPWHNTLTFFGTYAATKGTIPPLFDVSGRTYQISGRYTVPLADVTWPSVLTYKQSVGAGFDYKYNRNSLLFGGQAANGSTLYDVDQFVLTYDGAETDAHGQTTISDQLYLSPGDWGGDNNNTAFNAAHSRATSGYTYNTLVLERLTKLPADFSLLLRGTLQMSDSNLVPSEQLGFGGYDTVRGYDEREVNADEGFIFTTEVRSPSISFGNIYHWAGFNDELQILAFWDYGSAENHDPLPGEPDETPLSALGFGLRFSFNTYLTLRYDYGFQLLRTGFDNDHGSKSDIGLVLSY